MLAGLLLKGWPPPGGEVVDEGVGPSTNLPCGGILHFLKFIFLTPESPEHIYHFRLPREFRLQNALPREAGCPISRGLHRWNACLIIVGEWQTKLPPRGGLAWKEARCRPPSSGPPPPPPNCTSTASWRSVHVGGEERWRGRLTNPPQLFRLFRNNFLRFLFFPWKKSATCKKGLYRFGTFHCVFFPRFLLFQCKIRYIDIADITLILYGMHLCLHSSDGVFQPKSQVAECIAECVAQKLATLFLTSFVEDDGYVGTSDKGPDEDPSASKGVFTSFNKNPPQWQWNQMNELLLPRVHLFRLSAVSGAATAAYRPLPLRRGPGPTSFLVIVCTSGKSGETDVFSKFDPCMDNRGVCYAHLLWISVPPDSPIFVFCCAIF